MPSTNTKPIEQKRQVQMMIEKPDGPKRSLIPLYSVENIPNTDDDANKVISFFTKTKREIGVGRTNMKIGERLSQGENFTVVGIGIVYPAGIKKEHLVRLRQKHPAYVLVINDNDVVELPTFLIKKMESIKGGNGELVEIQPGDYTPVQPYKELPTDVTFRVEQRNEDGDFSGPNWESNGIDIGVVLIGQGLIRN